MIGKKAEEVLNRAVRYAFEKQHEYFTLEHVLLSLMEEPFILEIIQACNGSYTQLKGQLEDYLEKETPKTARSRGGDSPQAEGDADVDADSESDEDEGMIEHPVATLSIQRLVQRALFHVQSAGKDEIEPEDLFVALFQSKDSQALHLLRKQGLERLDVLNYISHGIRKENEEDEELETSKEGSGEAKKGVNLNRGKDRPADSLLQALTSYTTNLNDLAKQGKIDPLIGREKELDRVVQTLLRRRKNNPLLVGEAGVGKTAIAEGIALRIFQDEIPPLLKNAQVFSLDLGSLLAGAKFRGDFEQRLKRVLKALQYKKSKEKIQPILFIDEIHTIIGAGAVSGGVLDAANLVKPFLARGEIQCLGSTTYNEYRNVFEKDTALVRRFQKIDVPEPTKEEAVKILKGLKESFEGHHKVRYEDDALQAAVELSVKHITDRFLPDKAIDLMDEVGAKLRIRRSKSPELDQEEVLPVTQELVEEIVAEIARIPTRSVSTSQKDRLKRLERDLKLAIFGQDHAISALVTSIQLARSGLRSGDRPVGSFLFCGPTGVGKTELSKQLAHALGVPFLRFDMSEYMEKHTVSRLIGAPPGYVGFEQAGLLTDAVLKNPHSVILLDEIEKAHLDLINILLQVMDHGVLTDNNGRKADFRNATLIMTSNVGSREMERSPLGFKTSVDSSDLAARQAVERAFSPEFRNRLDGMIFFNPLDPVTIGQIVGKQLIELEAQLLAKNVEIEVDSEVREWLAAKGYDRRMGARPMGRLIQDKIKRVLAEKILFGELEQGGHVRLTLKSDEKDESKSEIDFHFEPKKKPPRATESDSLTSRSDDFEN